MLEIIYNIGKPDLTFKDHVSVWVAPTWPGQLSRIELSEGSVKRVKIVWSAEKHSFIVEGPKSSSKWRIIVPVVPYTVATNLLAPNIACAGLLANQCRPYPPA